MAVSISWGSLLWDALPHETTPYLNLPYFTMLESTMSVGYHNPETIVSTMYPYYGSLI